MAIAAQGNAMVLAWQAESPAEPLYQYCVLVAARLRPPSTKSPSDVGVFSLINGNHLPEGVK
jgi:hypothetical protein